jgi:hypothetical protein
VKWHRAFNGLMSGAALLLPLTAVPESRIESGAASRASSAMAHVNFKIIIPQVLYLRVGAGNDGLAGMQTVGIMSNGRTVTMNSTDRAPDSNAPARRTVILNASARKPIAQEAQCTPTPAPTGTLCTVSMP